MPMVSNPAVAISGTFGSFFKTIVNGPGKKTAMNFDAVSVTSAASNFTCSTSETCAINGLSPGRCFASKIFAIAKGSKTFAPRPYTVSVGKAAIPPRFMNSAASAGDLVRTVFTKEVSRKASNNAKQEIHQSHRLCSEFPPLQAKI